MEMISEENAFVHVSGHPNRDDLKICIVGKASMRYTSSWRTPT